MDVGLKLQLLSLVEAECPDVVVTAAQAGDTESIVKFLQKYPDEVLLLLYPVASFVHYIAMPVTLSVITYAVTSGETDFLQNCKI